MKLRTERFRQDTSPPHPQVNGSKMGLTWKINPLHAKVIVVIIVFHFRQLKLRVHSRLHEVKHSKFDFTAVFCFYEKQRDDNMDGDCSGCFDAKLSSLWWNFSFQFVCHTTVHFQYSTYSTTQSAKKKPKKNIFLNIVITYHWLGRFCFLATCWGPNMSRMGWNGHSTGNFTWYLSSIGSHFDCTILRTTRALSREHDILKTLGPGQGISDRKQNTITCEQIVNVNLV